MIWVIGTIGTYINRYTNMVIYILVIYMFIIRDNKCNNIIIIKSYILLDLRILFTYTCVPVHLSRNLFFYHLLPLFTSILSLLILLPLSHPSSKHVWALSIYSLSFYLVLKLLLFYLRYSHFFVFYSQITLLVHLNIIILGSIVLSSSPNADQYNITCLAIVI